MLTAVAFSPGAPLLVPALCGPGATDVVELRASVEQVARRLSETAQQWVAVGVGDPDSSDIERGTFAGFGVDEQVSLRPVTPADPAGVSPVMSTPMLVAGWIRGQFAPDAIVTPTLIDPSTTPRDCARIGAEIGARIVGTEQAVGVLVLADGSYGLTARAPGGLIEGAGDAQGRIDASVRTGDLDAIGDLDARECADLGIAGRSAWQVAAALWRTAVGPDRPSAHEVFGGAPFGVGYQVAWWGR